jgi:hypothetical protein
MNFGCYEKFYGMGHHYLALLNLGGDDDELTESIATLSKLTVCDSWQVDTVRLLSDMNWRSHLAPVVSYLTIDGSNHEVDEAIWKAIQRGSWVSPQLVASLHIKHFDFSSRITSLFSTGVEREAGTMLELHVATGPGNDDSRLGKIVNSLSGLGFNDWGEMSIQKIEELKKKDFDNADQISQRWHNEIIRLLKSAQQ